MEKEISIYCTEEEPNVQAAIHSRCEILFTTCFGDQNDEDTRFKCYNCGKEFWEFGYGD